MSDSKQAVKNIVSALPTLLVVAVVDVETGMPLASHTNVSDFDVETAAAYNTEVIKAKQKAITALQLDQKLQDVLLTLTDQLHLLRIADDGNTFMYLAVNARDTNLAQARQVIKANSGFMN